MKSIPPEVRDARSPTWTAPTAPNRKRGRCRVVGPEECSGPDCRTIGHGAADLCGDRHEFGVGGARYGSSPVHAVLYSIEL